MADTGHYRGRPKLDRVIFALQSDPTSAMTAVLAGEADFREVIPPDFMTAVAASEEVRAVPYRSLNYGFLAFNQRAKGSRGKWPYIVIGLREGVTYRGRRYTVELDGGAAYRGRALLLAFANGREYGMGAQLAPAAELDDGLLDAFVIDDRSVAARFWDSRHLALGSVERAPGIVVRRIRRANCVMRSTDATSASVAPSLARNRSATCSFVLWMMGITM